MWWQWHQLDHMQIIFNLLQTDNHASTSSLSFHRPDTLSAAQPRISKTEGILSYKNAFGVAKGYWDL